MSVQDTRAFSPASLAKGYLAAMGIVPPLLKFSDLDPAVLGVAMEAFYGARAESRVRRVVVPVAYCDVLSMYPTVNVLLGNWNLLTAARIEVEDCTVDVRRLLGNLDPRELFDPRTWPQLNAFCQVQPDGDVLPVRARYDGSTFGIGVNPLHAGPRWYALPDVVASRLLTGRAPRVLRALRLQPDGVQDGLRPVRVAGTMPVDPRAQDFFQSVIELRKSSTDEGADLALKILANAGAYGIFVEYVRTASLDPVPLVVLSGNLRLEVSSEHPEAPGAFSFPPIGSVITAAARLVLAMIERCVTDLGGTVAMMDTDSATIVSTEAGGLVPCPGGPLRALSWAEVERVRARFDAMKPYDANLVPNDVLELEPVNFAPCDHGDGCPRCRKGVDRTRRRQLHLYGISAKRYVLLNLGCGDALDPTGTWDGRPPLYRKFSEHGLGYLLDPADPAGEAAERQHRDEPVPDALEDEMSEVAAGVFAHDLPPHKRWILTAWDWMVRRDGLHQAGLQLPAWRRKPAVSQLRVSTPEVLNAFRCLNDEKPYADQVKPGGFLLAVHRDPLAASFSRPLDAARLDRAPDAWPALRRYVLRRGGLAADPYSPDDLPRGLHRKNGLACDLLAAEMPHECPEARGLWNPDDGADAMLDALHQALAAYDDQLRARSRARTSIERDFDPNRFQLVAPFSKDPRDWLRRPWIDRWSGRPFRITARRPSMEDVLATGEVVVRTIEEILISYQINPELKSLDPLENVPCHTRSRGLLHRRPVTSNGTPLLIGKEANHLEERQAGLRREVDSLNTYGRRCAGCRELLEDGSDPRRRFHNETCRKRKQRRPAGLSAGISEPRWRPSGSPSSLELGQPIRQVVGVPE